MRLGRRQLDVLQGAAEGKAAALGGWRGTFYVSGAGNDVHPMEVLERLLDLNLIELEEHGQRNSKVLLTDAGLAELFARSTPTCPVCDAYPHGCVRGCTARAPWGAPA